MTMLKSSFAERLLMYRRGRKMTRNQVCEASKISHTHLWNIEVGNCSPTLDTVELLIEVFPELELTFRLD